MVDRSSGDLLPPGRTVEERLSNNNGVTLSVSMDQSSNLDAIANGQRIPNHTCAEESKPLSISEHISSQCCTDGAALDPESAETKHEAEKPRISRRKHKHKKEINLPRRASKRLAGIKLDPVPELKTSNRARRVPIKEAVEGEAITNVDKSLNFLPNGTSKRFDATNTIEPGQCELQENQDLGISDKDQECFSFLPLENTDTKLDYSLDLPLGELLTDPCIAFAIQTLTGVTFESCENSQKTSELKNIKHSQTSGAAEGHNEEIKLQNIGDNNTAADAEIGQKVNENSGSSSSEEVPIDISWMDPCTEFAIKTLTDPNSENFLQRQVSSSNTQGHCEMA